LTTEPTRQTDAPERHLGVVRTYDDLHRLLRERAEALNVSRNVLDDAAGLQNGYTSKILSPRPTKRLGAVSMGLMLQALGVKLLAVEDEEALAKIRPMLTPREISVGVRAVMRRNGRHARKNNEVSLRHLRRIAPTGGEARALALSPAQRRSSARKAALIRWRKEAARLRQSSNG
jgi:hypothetical protein